MATSPHRVTRALRRAILMFLTVTGAGTVGYMLIEGWNVWDAFYMTIITITTVGYGDRFPVTFLGRVTGFSVMIAGVGIIGALASILARVVFPAPVGPKKAVTARRSRSPSSRPRSRCTTPPSCTA